MLALHIHRDRVIDAVAADANRMRDDHPRQGDDRDRGRAAADIADRVASRFGDRKAGADRGRQRLVDEPRLPRAGGDGRLGDRAALD